MSKRESVKQKINEDKLVTGQSLLDRISSILDSVIFIFFCLVSIGSAICLEYRLHIDGEFAWFLFYILSPFLLLFGVYGIYRVLQNKRYTTINTGLDKSHNRNIIIEFLKSRGYKILKQSDTSLFVIEEESLSYDELWATNIWFEFMDGSILFNIQKHYPIINPPVIFSHLLLQRDIKGFILKKGNQLE